MSDLTYNIEAIAAHFNRAAGSYNAAAELQTNYIMRALDLIPTLLPSNARVLDIGSGTGNFARLAHEARNGWNVIGIDISPAMCVAASPHQHSVIADMSEIPIKSECMDGVMSAFALQWSNHPLTVFKEIHRCLKPNAPFLLYSFTEGTLEELRKSAENEGYDQVVNGFLSADMMIGMLKSSGFQIETSKVDSHSKIYEMPWHLFRELKNLGATNSMRAKEKGLGNREKLKDIARNYSEHFGDSYGVPATWNVVSILARKIALK